MNILDDFAQERVVDALIVDDISSVVIGFSKWRCSFYGNRQGGHVFIYLIRASEPAKTRPDECAVCGNKDFDAYDG